MWQFCLYILLESKMVQMHIIYVYVIQKYHLRCNTRGVEIHSDNGLQARNAFRMVETLCGAPKFLRRWKLCPLEKWPVADSPPQNA